jgi:hypothetical protein
MAGPGWRIGRVSSFPWNSFFISVGPLVGALGGVWIKGRQDASREQRQAQRIRQDASEDRRRGTYADFVTAAQLLLRNQRQLGHAFATRTDTRHEWIQDVFVRGNRFQDDLNKATVAVELLGSTEARRMADAVIEAVKACSNIITAYSGEIYAHQSRAAASVSDFPSDDLDAAMDEANTAVDAFIDAVRPELSPWH